LPEFSFFWKYTFIRQSEHLPIILDKNGYWVISLIVYGIFAYEVTHLAEQTEACKSSDHDLFISDFYSPKVFIVLFLLIDDIFRTGGYLIGLTKPRKIFPGKKKFLSLWIRFGGVLSALFIDGITFGKYRHKVRRVRINFANLPKSFKGYKIVQISDVHSGSFLIRQTSACY
jgi:hypothetical protein